MLCCVVGCAARRGGMRQVWSWIKWSEMPRRNTVTSGGAASAAHVQFHLNALWMGEL